MIAKRSTLMRNPKQNPQTADEFRAEAGLAPLECRAGSPEIDAEARRVLTALHHGELPESESRQVHAKLVYYQEWREAFAEIVLADLDKRLSSKT